MRPKDSILANINRFSLIGILAGALAGLGVGAMTGDSVSSVTVTNRAATINTIAAVGNGTKAFAAFVYEKNAARG
jgi:hypothetical protein